MRKLALNELGRVSLVEYKQQEKFPLLVALDNIRSMYNVGSVFRTADAFAVEKIILGGISARPPHREIHKTALGAEESVDWLGVDHLPQYLSALRQEGYTIWGIEQTDASYALSDVFPPKESKIVLVFGNEVSGIDPEIIPLLDMAIEIPQFGTKHSLNVSVAAGIVLYDLTVKLSAAKK